MVSIINLLSILLFFSISTTTINGAIFKNISYVTYPGIGKFSTEDFFDLLHRPLVYLPQSPQHIDPKFMLFNKNIHYGYELLKFNSTESFYKSTNFTATLETKIITHGFLENSSIAPWMFELKDRFLKKHNYNVIVVDWGKGNQPPYAQATANTRIVGAMIGILIENLCKTFRVPEGSFHVLGHSLGAHVAGYAGKWVKGKLGHITGFDPAGPNFEGLKDHQARLWHTDAQFVEVIHTDCVHSVLHHGFGICENCGHVDIYPNGGANHPGCDNYEFKQIVINHMKGEHRKTIECNHKRSVDFYLESILDPKVPPIAFECQNYESFLNGQCSSCGKTGSRCVKLGPRSLLFKQFIQDPEIPEGKQYFIRTAGPPNYFQYQYVVTIEMDRKSALKNPPYYGAVLLKFLDWKNQGSYSVFNQKHLKFDHQKSYTELIVSEMPPDHLMTIKLKFSKYDKYFYKKLKIKNIEVYALYDQTGQQHNIKKMIFKPTVINDNDDEIVFEKAFSNNRFVIEEHQDDE